MSIGRVYLVGAGPGDPGLLTVRGRQLLEQAEVVVYDYLASPRLLELAPPSAERIYVGKQAAAHTLRQEQINQLLVEQARLGRLVVRLKGGDPFIFGRGGEEALALAEAGVEFEVVPGVTSGVAGPAYAGIPVTHRNVATCVGLVAGHETPDKGEPTMDWPALAAWPGTLVFYMGVENLGFICRKLIEHGQAADTPAAAVRWGTTPQQQTVEATLATLAGAVARANLRPPAVIVVGPVVALRGQLAWFERRPLLGRRIVVTRARAQASGLAARLEQLGAEVIELPAIRIEPPATPAHMDAAVGSLGRYDWVILTSVNGVDALWAALERNGLDARALAGRLVAAIGEPTADALARRGIRADLVPPQFTSGAVVGALAGRELRGRRVLCPRADIAPPEMIDQLRQAGAEVDEVVAYRTVPDNAGAPALAERLARGEIHWLTFTSSSTVRNFLAAIPAEQLCPPARIASIGPATSQTLREAHLEPAVEASPHTIPGLVEAILQGECGDRGQAPQK